MIDPNTANRIHEEMQLRLDAMRERAEKAERERDYLISEYERAVGCGEQGFAHAAGHIFNAIVNARCDTKVAERERDKLAAHVEKYRALVDMDMGQAVDEIERLQRIKPAASLAAHDAALKRDTAYELASKWPPTSVMNSRLRELGDKYIERGES